MANYYNENGEIYTIQEIEDAAKEYGKSTEEIISINGLSIEPPKKKPAARKKLPDTANTDAVAVSNQKASNKKNTASKSTGGSLDSQEKQSKGKKMPELKEGFDLGLGEQKQDQPSILTEEKKKQKTFTKELKTALPLMQKRKKIREAKTAEELSAMRSDVLEVSETDKASLDALQAEINKNKKAKDLLANAPQLSAEAIYAIDEDINNKKKTDGEAYYETPGYKTGAIVGGLAPATGVKPVKKYVNNFEKEKNQVIAELKRDGLLESTSKGEILDRAAKLAKKNAILAAKESLWRDYLENNTDIDVKTKNLLKDYTSLKGSVAQTNLAKNMMLIEDTVKAGDVLYKEFLEAKKSLKPADYKFTSQEELNSEIEKINSINSKITKLKDYDSIIKKYNKDNKKNNKDIEDSQFEFDMLKRDYSYSGVASKFGDTVSSWSLDLLGFANLISSIPEAQLKLFMPEDLVEEFESTSFSAKKRAIGISEEKRRIEKYIEDHYAKSRDINDMESFMENTWESFSRFAPDLALMYLTGGGSKAAQKIVQEGSETFLKSAFKKLAPTKTSLSIGARVAGSESLAMTDEMKNGYYDEDGNFFKPEYNDLQLIAVPLLKGYVEGKFEEVTQNIFEKGGRFFNSVAKNEPQKWYNFTKYATKDLVKKAGLEYLTSQAEEGASEALTTWANNIIDVTLLGKDKNIFEGTGETLKESFLLTNVLSGVPHVGGLMIRPFMPVTNAETLSTNATKMSEILDKLKDKNLTSLQKTDLEKQLATLRKSSNNIINSTVSNISDMPSASFEFVNNAVDAMASLKSQAREVSQREDITPEEKAENIKALRAKYNENAADLNTLMSRFSSTKFYNKAFNSADKRKVLGLITEAFQAQKQLDEFNRLGDQSSADIAKNEIKSIEDQINNIYASNDVDLNEERQREFDENLNTVKKIASDKNIIVVEAQNEQELLNKISQNKLPLGDKEKAIAAKSTGFNYIDPDGREFIFVNRQNAVQKNLLNTAAHEFLHSMLNAGLGKSSSRIPLAQELLLHLAKIDLGALEGTNLFSRLEKYQTQGTEIQAEEVLTIFSDVLASGALKYNENTFTKIGDYIRRFLQDVFGYSISFNSGRDVYNFIKDYNNSIAKGKLNKSQKNVFEKGISGKLITDKTNIDVKGNIKASLSEDEYNEKYNEAVETYNNELDKLDNQLASGEIDEDGYDLKADKLEREYNKKIAALEVEKEETKSVISKPVEQKPLLSSEVDPNAKLKNRLQEINDEYSKLEGLLNTLTFGSKEYLEADAKAEALEKEKADLEYKLKNAREVIQRQEREKEITEKKKFSKKQKQYKEPSVLEGEPAKEKALLDNIGNKTDKVNLNDPVLVKVLQKMIWRKVRYFRTNDGRNIDLTDPLQGGPAGGINGDELVAATLADMLVYIGKFDKSKNNSLYGYINAQLLNRIRGVLRRGDVINKEFLASIDERKQGSETDYYEGTGERSDAGLAYDAYSDESTYNDNMYPSRPVYKPLLEANMFHLDTIERFKKSLISVVGTLKTKINQPITPNKKVSDFINEILNDVKENNWGDLPSGEGIRTAMGSTNELFKKWLIKNKKAILENMTTTYLMGKDRGIDKDGVPQVDGGIPVAVQKRVDGVWLSFPDWVGKKIDREDVKTDLAGRTAGHIIVRRLPDVSLNISDDVFLSYFIKYNSENKIERIPDRDKNLAKQIAGELALELISKDFIYEGTLYQALEKNQMRLGAAIERLTIEEFNRQAERGNIKFSQAAGAYVALKDSKFVLDIALQDPEFNKIWNESDMDGFAKLNISQLSLKLQKLSGDRKKRSTTEFNVDNIISDSEKLALGKPLVLFSMTDDNTYKSTIISDFLNSQKTKSISGEASLEIIDEFRQSIENYWGKVPDSIIDWMYNMTDYTKDVIEDRLKFESDLMGFLNGSLNYQALDNLNKTVNKQLSELNPNNQQDIKFSLPGTTDSLNEIFNEMIERKTGVPAPQTFGDLEAKRLGKKSDKFYWFMAPGVDDFEGLTSYMFSGDGYQGEVDKQFFQKYLIKPYLNALNKLDVERNIIKEAYKQLLNNNKEISNKLNKGIGIPGYTYDHAIRIYLWNVAGYDIPGLTSREIRNFVNFVKQDPSLVSFANALSIIGRDKNKGWIAPDTYWNGHTILSDLYRITEGQLRNEFLTDFIENADIIFSKENLNKVQVVMGDKVRYAIEDILRRMKTGSNSPKTGAYDKTMAQATAWLNGATASIMFFNIRSAVLQLTSIPNFLNADFNNPLQAFRAAKDVKQYSEDFLFLFNSPKLVERRNGLKADVTSSEIANAANEKNSVMSIISLMLKKGFLPTQIADSISICTLGATYYRNLANKLMQDNPGWSKEKAEREAMKGVSARIEKMMQSSDPMFVSQQQSSILGRSILTFGNASMQYQRLIAKAASDIKNGRGSTPKNVARILYYGAIQNAIFTALQQMVFGTYFWAAGDDEEEKKKLNEADKKMNDFWNSMADSLLRGSGIYGALISMVKNAGIVAMEQYGVDLSKEFKDMPIKEELEYQKEKGKKTRYADDVEVVIALANLSPPLGSKLRKGYSFWKQGRVKEDVIKARGWDLTADGKLSPGPNYKRYGNLIEAVTNVPLGRIATKVENLAAAIDDQNSNTQRVLSALGWGNYELGIKNKVNEQIKEEAKFQKKVETAKDRGKSALQKKEDKKRLIDSLGGKAAYFKYKKLGIKTDEEIEKEKIKAAAKGYDYDKMQKMSKSELWAYKRKIDKEYSNYYIDSSGNVYSISEIQKVAEDNNTTPENIIKVNKLQEKKGKR